MTSLRSVYNLTDAPYERPTEAPSISVGPLTFLSRGLLRFRVVTLSNAASTTSSRTSTTTATAPWIWRSSTAPAPRRRRVCRQAGALICYLGGCNSIYFFQASHICHKDAVVQSHGGVSFRRLAGCSAARASSSSVSTTKPGCVPVFLLLFYGPRRGRRIVVVVGVHRLPAKLHVALGLRSRAGDLDVGGRACGTCSLAQVASGKTSQRYYIACNTASYSVSGDKPGTTTPL